MKKWIAGIVCFSLVAVACMAGFASDAQFVASKNSDKYHMPVCAAVQKIAAENKITYATPEEALKAGLTQCKVCNPPARTEAYVGSKLSDKYHTTGCTLAQRITAENKVSFASKAEAEKAGYKPCQVCCK